MTPLRKVLTMTLCLCAVTVLFSWIAWRLGYEGFLVTGHIELPFFIELGLAMFFYHVSAFVLISIALGIYDRRIVWYMLPFAVIAVPMGIVLDNGITSVVFPFVYPLVILLAKRDFQGIVRLVFVYVVIAVLQVAALVTATGEFSIWHNHAGYYQTLVMQIDLIIFMALLYSIYGVMHYAKQRTPLPLEHYIHPEDWDAPTLDDEDRKEIAEFNTLTGLTRIKAVALLLTFQIAQWSLILFVGSLGNVFIEILAVSTSFVLHGLIIRKRWHSPSLIICTLSSAVLLRE